MELLYGKELRRALEEDLKIGGPLDLFIYNMELDFLEELFGQYANRNRVSILCDYRMRLLVGMFLHSHDVTLAKHWPKNGMLHMKVMIFPERNLVYLGSHNFTRFAWQAAQNMTLRVENVPIARKVKDRFDYLWCKAVIANPVEPSLNSNGLKKRWQQDAPGVPFGGDAEGDGHTSYGITET